LAASKDFVFQAFRKTVYTHDYSGKLLWTIVVRREVNDAASVSDDVILEVIVLCT